DLCSESAFRMGKRILRARCSARRLAGARTAPLGGAAFAPGASVARAAHNFCGTLPRAARGGVVAGPGDSWHAARRQLYGVCAAVGPARLHGDTSGLRPGG